MLTRAQRQKQTAAAVLETSLVDSVVVFCAARDCMRLASTCKACAREADEHYPGGCVWRTKRVLHLPKTANFIDYSAFAVHHSTQAVAITSQEGSQLWVGELSGGADGAFDPVTAEFSDGAVYDFPRSSATCDVQYCNIEGIHWVSGGKMGEGGTPQMLVAVSDKMKSKGRQSAACQDKDQSVHLFTLP